MKKNYTFAVISILIWSTTAALIKSLLYNIPNMQALTLSSGCAFLFLLVVSLINGSFRKLAAFRPGQYCIMIFLGFIGQFLYGSFYYYGLSSLTSQEACILNYLWPVMVVIFSGILLKENLNFGKILAILCSFAGIVILSTGRHAAGTGNIPLGIASCLLAALCSGLFTVLNKKFNMDQTITMLVIWLTTFFCALIAGKLTETWIPVHGFSWIGILWLGAGINGLTSLLWALALNRSENTALIANLAYLTPFLSLIVSAVFLKEKLEMRAFLALLFIIGGILIQNLINPRKKEA